MVIEELFTRLGFQVDPKGIDKAKDALGSFKKWVGGLALGAGLISLAKTGVEAAMTMEGLNAQFTVMTGSAEKARDVIAQIADFAAHTPFDKLGLSSAAKTLMAFGLESEKVVPTLKMLGDVAGADQNKLNGLALVFGQIQSTGKLMGQDLLQLINQGFNPLTEISKQTGISVADLKDKMSQGAISADMVTLAFKSATSAGGLFYGNLEAQSQTLQGRISTLRDNFVTALQNMAEAFLPLMKAGVDVLVAFEWKPIIAEVRHIAYEVGLFVEELGTVVKWLKILSPLLLAVFGPKLIAMLLSAISSTRLYAGALTFVQRAQLAAGASANYHLTALGMLKAGMYSLSTTAKTMGGALKGAFKAALSPMMLALETLLSIKLMYDYFIEDAAENLKKEFEEKDIKRFRKGGTAEYETGMSEMVYKSEKKKYTKLILSTEPISDEELEKARKSYEDSKRQYQENVALYKAARGIDWRTYKNKLGKSDKRSTFEQITGNVSIGGDSDLAKQIAEMTKALNESSKSTKKNTKAVEDNTRKFNISDISRQAFDAAFNVKLKEAFITTI